uniref:C-type lectin domain-containing protein n=2 Tax=Macrostomum lignano TaxID=282301 RepID=A0A1I8HHD4_9PLAT
LAFFNNSLVCPDGWMASLHSCWYPVENRVTWTAASQFCSEHTWGGVRGRLLDAKTAVERSFVAPPSSGSDASYFSYFHTGLKRNASNNQWVWGDGTQPEVGAFYMGRPAPNCAALDTFTGTMVDVTCGLQLKFICQIDKYIGERQGSNWMNFNVEYFS